MNSSSDRPPGRLLVDCQQLLDNYRVRFADRPHEQYRRLSLLALEREQLVSFAYREDILGQRLTRCSGDPQVLSLFRYALLQLWRDEEAHTVFIRGELVRDAPGTRTPKVLIEQAAGLLAGWSSALKHHVPRSRAPMRNLMVDGLALGARLVGKLSPDLRSELDYKTFSEYCEYNVDAEETAELCWRRLIELDRELGVGNEAMFDRIAREENDHRQVFALIAESLDPHDAVIGSVTPEAIRDRLLAIGERMVEPSHRPTRSAIGNGGEVHVIGDSAAGTKTEALVELLARADLAIAGRRVAIKASWMMGYSTLDRTSTTDPEFLRALVAYLHERGAAEVVILDAENVYNGLFDGRQVETVAEHFGLTDLGCPVADAAADVVPIVAPTALGPTHISRLWVEADVRISVTRLRSHPTEHAHLATSNTEGLIADAGRSVFWNRSYDYSAAALAVACEAPATLAIIDAWDNCPDGWFGIMAGPHPKHPRRLYGGADSLAVDLVALRHTGSAEAIDSPTLADASRSSVIPGRPRPSWALTKPSPTGATRIATWRPGSCRPVLPRVQLAQLRRSRLLAADGRRVRRDQAATGSAPCNPRRITTLLGASTSGDRR